MAVLFSMTPSKFTLASLVVHFPLQIPGRGKKKIKATYALFNCLNWDWGTIYVL